MLSFFSVGKMGGIPGYKPAGKDAHNNRDQIIYDYNGNYNSCPAKEEGPYCSQKIKKTPAAGYDVIGLHEQRIFQSFFSAKVILDIGRAERLFKNTGT